MNLILDVETISIEYPYICDIAFARVERNKIISVENFIPMENLSKMAVGTFSAPKMANTMAEVENGNAKIMPWAEIEKILLKAFTETTNIYAYNAGFDRRAIISTASFFKSENVEKFTEFFDKWRDLWAWTANTIIYKKSFIDFCEINGLRTPKGFCSTSAETVLKYLRKNLEYAEKHTARADVLDEFDIYLEIKREIKKEFSDTLPDEEAHFKGKPFSIIKRLENAIEG